MEHFARWVVRHRKAVLAAAVLLLIPSVFGAAGTYINYDILTYLPPELDSMVGEGYLEDDFNMASTSMITVENMSTADTLALKSELEAVAGVKSVLWTSDILDVTTPKEMLPADIQKFFYSENGATLLLVQFENPSAHAVTMQAQRTIKDILRKDCFIGGMSAILEDTKSLVNQEMPVYILCAVGACLVVLFLSMKETVVPLIFMLGMVFPIVYNFGTNIFLGQINCITEALGHVFQLGVTMDFSIFCCTGSRKKSVPARMRTRQWCAPCKSVLLHSGKFAHHHRRLPRNVHHAPDTGARYRHRNGQGRVAGRCQHCDDPARAHPYVPALHRAAYPPYLHP